MQFNNLAVGHFWSSCHHLFNALILLIQVTPRLQELQLFRLQQESVSVAPSTDQRDNSLKKNVREKRKPVQDINDEQSPAKRQKDTAQLPNTLRGKDKVEGKNEANNKAQSRSQKGKPDGGDDSKIKDSRPDKPIQYKDQCTVFISNLSLQASCLLWPLFLLTLLLWSMASNHL